jgi:hypothetical protein
MRADRNRTNRTDHMPRRGTDRLEDLVALLLIWMGMGVLIVSAVLGLAEHVRQTERSRIEISTRTEILAVLLQDAPEHPTRAWRASPPATTPATWIQPDGRLRTGLVPAAPASKAGSEVHMWLDADGRLVGAPTTPLSATASALYTGIGTLSSGGAVLWGLWVGTRRWTAHRNSRQWEQEWARVEPEWRRIQ